MLLPFRERLCFAEEVLCLLTSGSGISGYLVTKSSGHSELPLLKINFLSPSHVFQELKDDIFSNLTYSDHVGNSQLTPGPAAKGCPSLVQVADIPGTSTPLSLFCTLHSRHADIGIIRNTVLYKTSPSIICPLCAAESYGYFGRLSQVVTSVVTEYQLQL